MLDFSLSEEQIALVETARRFSKERIIPAAAAADRDAKFPREVFEEAWKLGLINTTVPAEYGGAGLGELDNALITEQLAYGCTGIQTSMLANTLAGTPVLLAGSEAQKKKYLGMLTSEPRFAAYCTTEPSGGSDVAALKTSFKKVGSDYVLSGEKCWITNASLASFYVVFATAEVAKKHKGIAAFIVDRETPGLAVGKHEDKMGQRASDTAAVHFEEVKVSASNLLAPEGEGFKLAMETFNQTRPDIGAMAAGLMQRCLDESVAYARERKAFGADRGAPTGGRDAGGHGDPHRGNPAFVSKSRVEPRSRGTHADRVRLCQSLRGGRRDADLGRRGAGLRRQWLRQGLPGGKADARRQGAANLRGNEPNPAPGDRSCSAEGQLGKGLKGN